MDSSSNMGPTQFHALAELMATRRSIRRYALASIPPEVVDDLLRCAANAPSAHNRQPWRFAILRDAAVKTRLAHAMGTRLRQDRLADGAAAEVVEADARRSFERITGAPVVLVVATTTIDMDVYPDGSRREAEYLMAVQSTAMAVQNLLLAAHAAGIAGCWMCAPLFCPHAVRAALGLPADWQPQALVTLGVAESEGKPYRRRPLAEIVYRVDPT
jgi:coenzyme F420-0:L-glutamate ligase / coenzyme F420-1:gamma-L-glutamate ligase